MRTYPLNEARSEFSKVFDRALAGEPQRITRYGKEVAILVSEADWNAKLPPKPTLTELLLKYSGDGDGEALFGKTGLAHIRPLGTGVFETGFNDGD